LSFSSQTAVFLSSEAAVCSLQRSFALDACDALKGLEGLAMLRSLPPHLPVARSLKHSERHLPPAPFTLPFISHGPLHPLHVSFQHSSSHPTASVHAFAHASPGTCALKDRPIRDCNGDGEVHGDYDYDYDVTCDGGYDCDCDADSHFEGDGNYNGVARDA
jgi:hypothetical protein